VCHGANGEGRTGATLRDVFVSLDPEGDLRNVITKGRAGTLMPTWGEAYGGPLSEQDVNDLIAFIETWGTTYEPPATLPPAIIEDLPAVPEVDGDPNAGYLVFQANCAACHGEKGEGRTGATLNTTFTALNPGAFILETVRTGVSGTMMPAWSQENGGPLTDEQINDVAAYVLSIQKAPVTRPAEVTSQGSALPLILIGALSIVVILALAITTQNRDKS
jgi:mono/diheme cytochrome c family protein